MMLPLRLTNGLATDPNRRALVTGPVLCLAFLAIYVGSPIRTSLDSWWSIPTAMSFIHGQGGELSAYVPRPPDRVPASYALTTIAGHTYSIYPIGASLLAVPAVALASSIDPAFADIVKTAPDRFEKTVASFYGAVACALFFGLLFARFNDLRIAVATTLIFGLGTSMWSVATRALWQHGPLVLVLIVAMYLLVLAPRRPALAQYVSIPLALSFVIRPTAAIPVALISAYVLIYYRRWFGLFILRVAAIAIAWISYNILCRASLLPRSYL